MSAVDVLSVQAIDFDQYAAARGLSMSEIGDAGTHKRGRNQSDRQWKRLLRTVDDRSNEVLRLRAELRDEYAAKIERGEIRPLTRAERLQLTAAGHPDLPATQAARRILEKRAKGVQP